MQEKIYWIKYHDVVPQRTSERNNIMKHQYLMSINDDDWNNLKVIRKITDTSFAQLMREGLRYIVKQRLDNISQRRKMSESLSHMDSV
jgi:hypothetical protein